MPPRQQQINLLDPKVIAGIKLQERERFAAIDAGILDHPIFFKPCRIKILMLVDNGISYNQFYFGLSEVLDTLRLNPEWWVKFDITRAHRQTDPNKPAAASPAFALYGPHFESFRFDQAGFKLDDYDQVWFFGFNSGTTVPTALSDAELEILFRWMDKGGGMFATGDHARLGEALCSRIPRVRNMRKWTAADGVPSNLGPDRHDTLVKGHDFAGTAGVDESAEYTFDDESDDIPMKIKLRWYNHHYCHHKPWPNSHWHWPYFLKRYPHPILCGKGGVIDILPDHPHEGEVVVPGVLTDTLTRGAYSAREYPDLGGSPLSPQIIAWATVQNDHTNANSFKAAANGKTFGAVGAYNGHCVKVGRVVVDSTWHHWFDVNLTGRMVFGMDIPGNVTTGDPRKLNGFLDTPAGVAALDRIRNYFRNVAIWLARPALQKCMAKKALWNCMHKFPLNADLRADMPPWVIGRHAIEVLSKYAGKCQVLSWWPVLAERVPFELLLDPEKVRVPVESLDMLDEFMLGGILQQMLAAKEEKFPAGKLPKEEELDRIVLQGVQRGTEAMIEHADAAAAANRHLVAALKQSIG